jgi:hypothetical protein
MRELDKFGSALGFRESLRKFIRTEVERIRPRYRYAEVISFDINLGVAEVKYPGETETVTLPVSGGMPSVVGQIVRIEGLRGDRFVAGVSGSTAGAALHNSEVLKAEGVTPGTTYELEHKPKDLPHWPQVFAGGALQYNDVDYTIDKKELTVLPAMELRTAEKLYVDYDYLFGTALVRYPAYAARVLEEKPLGYWRLNEEGGAVAADISGHDRHAGLIAGLGYFQQHVGGDNWTSSPQRPNGDWFSALDPDLDPQAGHIDFNGNNRYAYMDVGTFGDLESFTIMYFIYHVGGAGGFETVNYGTTAQAFRCWEGFGAHLSIATEDHPFASVGSLGGLATFNNSYGTHRCATYDANTGEFRTYKNGAVQASGALAASPLINAVGNFRFGSMGGNSSGQGLSEVAIWGRALKETDILDIYATAVNQGFWWG